jgi:glycosyltransferase involved in cell wall biosynthesis
MHSKYNKEFKHPLVDMAQEDLELTRQDYLAYLAIKRQPVLVIGDLQDSQSPPGITVSLSEIWKYFEDYTGVPFELIFILGKDDHREMIKLIDISLSHLSNSGVLVLTDVRSRIENDIWKCCLHYRTQKELDCATLNIDHGLFTIRKRENSRLMDNPTDELTWDYYVSNHDTILSPLSYNQILVWLEEGFRKELICKYSKIDPNSPAKILLLTNEDINIELEYGSIWVYPKTDLDDEKTLIAKHQINVVWYKLPDGDLGKKAENEYYESVMKPILERKFRHPFEGDPVVGSPLVSIFTPVHRSGGRVKRAYRSLLDQSYDNWEWVIMVDCDLREKKDVLDYEILDEIIRNDARIRVYYTHRKSTSIGEMKNNTASLCQGKILLELDHDDELTPTCLEMLVKAYTSFHQPVFVYSYWAEPTELDFHKFGLYGVPYARGSGGYRSELLEDSWVPCCTGSTVDSYVCQHIVGIPNHLRSWRKDFYQFIDGHSYLWVADDYELVLRTYLLALNRIMVIPELLYFQYRNHQESKNTNFQRNAAIQRLSSMINESRLSEISKIMKHPDQKRSIVQDEFSSFPWTIDPNDFIHYQKVYREKDKEAYLYVLGENKDDCLAKIMETRDGNQPYEVLLAGVYNSWLDFHFAEEIIKLFPKSRVRWWNYHYFEITRDFNNPAIDHQDKKPYIAVRSCAMWLLPSISSKIRIFFGGIDIPEETYVYQDF